MNKLTIQINNLEALERLIGGDSEVEIEIRNSVIQNFAEKHLKPLANSPAITSTLSSIKDAIQNEIKKQCEAQIATFTADYYGRTSDVKLRPEIKAEIDRQVRLMTDSTIQKSVEEATKTWADETRIKKSIESRFECYTLDVINTEIRTRLEKLKTKL